MFILELFTNVYFQNASWGINIQYLKKILNKIINKQL